MYCLPDPTAWNTWMQMVEPLLRLRQKVPVPDWLPHPMLGGFDRLSIAEDVGQVEDYALSLSGSERVHVHVFANGHREAHMDHDPAAGIGPAIKHLLWETKAGPILLVGLVGVVIAGLVHAASRR